MKTAVVSVMLLTVAIVACSSDQVKLGKAGYIRPNTQIVVLNGGQNGQPLGALYSGEYFWTYMQPGPYQLTAMFNYEGKYRGNGLSTVVNLDAGKTYYFQVIQKPASHIQDIVLKQKNEFNSIADYKSAQSQPTLKKDMALVYFYYQRPILVNGIIVN